MKVPNPPFWNQKDFEQAFAQDTSLSLFHKYFLWQLIGRSLLGYRLREPRQPHIESDELHLVFEAGEHFLILWVYAYARAEHPQFQLGVLSEISDRRVVQTISQSEPNPAEVFTPIAENSEFPSNLRLQSISLQAESTRRALNLGWLTPDGEVQNCIEVQKSPHGLHLLHPFCSKS